MPVPAHPTREDLEREIEAAQHNLGPVSAIHFDAPQAERAAFKVGLTIGRRDEQNRILAGLDALLRETAALWFEGTAPTRAVAVYTARVREVVEGRKP